MLPVVLSLGAQVELGFDGPFWFYLTVVSFGIFFFGIGIVGWVFCVEGFKEDVTRYKAPKRERPKD